ncbi:MATE family efflux transporter [cf. Phormidesmis sp. LEGE 11477]|uniref:MATE family efflux transporter n=1 Tax=cf. Phormidesmis sp. LEGE 11477 TaxID=1828680 RepID=UPI00187FD538|nr:MATE family efflux transporter [cf. Phormidesmis sp. LEGE 11477]MBE9062540.1 MATE family efflux transporter [cf. Phormidesmis sp. LEGE 11477]
MLFNQTPAWIRPFCKLAIANTTSGLMVPLAGLIDTAFLGHLSDVRYLNGVALASVIFNVIYWGFNFFRMGTTGPVAQAVGRDDEKTIWLILLRNSLLALGAGLAVLLLRQPISAIGFYFLHMGPGVRAAAVAFFEGRIVGAPAVLVNFVVLGWLLGRGRGAQVVWLAAIGNGSNVVLDYWFIRRLGWESYGAGLATALSQYVMLAVGCSIVAASLVPWHLLSQIKAELWQPKELRMLFSLNRDILIRTFALVLAMSSFTNFSSGLGETILGINALLIQVVLMSAHFMDGVALAVESYAGRFYGQRSVDDLLWLLWLGAGGSVFLGIAIALTLTIWPLPFFSLLTTHNHLLVQLPTYVYWLVPVLGFGGVAFTLDGYFLGLTSGHILRNSALISVLLGFLPLALLANWSNNPHLLWLALSVLMALRGVTLIRQVPIINQRLLNKAV